MIIIENRIHNNINLLTFPRSNLIRCISLKKSFTLLNILVLFGVRREEVFTAGVKPVNTTLQEDTPPYTLATLRDIWRQFLRHQSRKKQIVPLSSAAKVIQCVELPCNRIILSWPRHTFDAGCIKAQQPKVLSGPT